MTMTLATDEFELLATELEELIEDAIELASELLLTTDEATDEGVSDETAELTAELAVDETTADDELTATLLDGVLFPPPPPPPQALRLAIKHIKIGGLNFLLNIMDSLIIRFSVDWVYEMLHCISL